MGEALIGISIGSILLAVSLLLGSKRHRWANRLLAINLLLQASAFGLHGFFPAHSEYTHFILVIILLAWGPIFSMYIALLTKGAEGISIRSIAHVVPLVVFGFGYRTAPTFLPYFFMIQGLLYSVLITRKLYLHQHKIRNRFSNLSQIKLHWVYIFVTIYMAVSLTYALAPSLRSTFLAEFFTMKYLAGFCMAYGLSLALQTLRQKDFCIIQPQSPTCQVPPYLPSTSPKYFSSDTLNRFIQFVEEEKPYLNPHLRIESVSHTLGIPKHTLSHLLTQKLHQSFYDFISEYRVEEAKQLILQNSHSQLDEQFIASHTGFESRAQFLHTFRQHTGMSPQAFQRHLALEIA